MIGAVKVASVRGVPVVPTVHEAVENLVVATGVGGKTGAVEPECGGGCVVDVVAAVVVGASAISAVPIATASAIDCAAVAVVVATPPSETPSRTTTTATCSSPRPYVPPSTPWSWSHIAAPSLHDSHP